MASKQPLQETEIISLKPRGKYTYPNPLSEVPQGAMVQALNVVISRPSVIEQRRGVAPIGDAFSSNVLQLYSFQNRILALSGTTLAYYSLDLLTRTNYSGSFTKPDSALVSRSFQANKNFYFLTNTGIKKIDDVTSAVTFAGAPAGLDGSGSTTGSGWFTSHTNVAYRIVWAYTDANGNLVRGAPSQRIVVANGTGGATNVALDFTMPDGITTTWQYEVYRSPMSIDLATAPNDECALVYTGNPTAPQIAARVVTLTDSIPDSLKGEFIYTASSQQGISQANYQPPIATDVAYFNEFTFAVNTTSQQQALLTLVAVGSPALQNNDTIVIAGTTYTAKASETIASGEFKLSTGGTPSQNITDTANSLVRVINRYLTNTLVYAYYSSGYTDLPGRIIVKERGIGGAVFTLSCSRPGAFVPDIGVTTLSSSNERSPNAIAISKYRQPEAFPIGQVLYAGSADKSILRVIALRDYVLIFKQDGVYQIVGTDVSSFAIQLVDSSMILRGLETAVALNNKVYCFSNQTVVSITFNEGTVLKDLPIQKELLVISSPLYPAFDAVSYGIAYESENSYILGTVTNTTDTTVTQYYVYNYLTDSWTNWQFPYTQGCGFVNPTDNKLYFGSSDSASRYLYQERKNYTDYDFADNAYPITIVSSDELSVQVNDSSIAQVGWTLNQDDRVAVITDIPDATHLTVSADLEWTAGDASVYVPISVAIQFVPEHGGNPGIVKHFKECHGIFSNANFTSFDLGFSTDFYDAVNYSTLKPKQSTGFGLAPFGPSPWGGGTPQAQVIRGWVPLNQRRGHWLNVSVNYANALTNFSLDGLIIYYQSMSQKFH